VEHNSPPARATLGDVSADAAAAVPVADRLTEIRSKGAMLVREVAELVGTSPGTVSRWQHGRAQPREANLARVMTLEWLVGQLAELYPPRDAREWLLSPHELLGGERPYDRIEQGRTDDVLAVIEQLTTGAYV
jgi:transcriptional regulator with XRE-family HTH domain